MTFAGRRLMAAAKEAFGCLSVGILRAHGWREVPHRGPDGFVRVVFTPPRSN